MEQVIVRTSLVTHTCLTCGIQYAIPADYDEELKLNHRTFYCPRGHTQYYPSETEEERLRKALLQEQKKRREYQEEYTKLNRQLNGALGQLSKVKERINAGICPYCRRHFANLERHIQSKHKDKL